LPHRLIALLPYHLNALFLTTNQNYFAYIKIKYYRIVFVAFS